MHNHSPTEQNPVYFRNYPYKLGNLTTIAIWVEEEIIDGKNKVRLAYSSLNVSNMKWSQTNHSAFYDNIEFNYEPEKPLSFGYPQIIGDDTDDITPLLNPSPIVFRTTKKSVTKTQNPESINNTYANSANPNQKVGRPKKAYEDLAPTTRRIYDYYERKEKKDAEALRLSLQTECEVWLEYRKNNVYGQNWEPHTLKLMLTYINEQSEFIPNTQVKIGTNWANVINFFMKDCQVQDMLTNLRYAIQNQYDEKYQKMPKEKGLREINAWMEEAERVKKNLRWLGKLIQTPEFDIEEHLQLAERYGRRECNFDGGPYPHDRKHYPVLSGDPRDFFNSPSYFEPTQHNASNASPFVHQPTANPITKVKLVIDGQDLTDASPEEVRRFLDQYDECGMKYTLPPGYVRP